MSVHGSTNQVFPVLANTIADGSIGCNGGKCPTVYEADENTLIVQGYRADDQFETGFVPDGEGVVRIPKGLLRQLVANHLLD